MSVDWGKAMRPTVHDLVEATNGNTDYIQNTLPGLLDEKADVTALPHIEHGITETTGAANADRTVAVTFDRPFTSTPAICATLYTTAPANGSVSISAPSTTGFTIKVKYSTASNIPVHWIAVGE